MEHTEDSSSAFYKKPGWLIYGIHALSKIIVRGRTVCTLGDAVSTKGFG